MKHTSACLASSPVLVAPLYGEGRGLKQEKLGIEVPEYEVAPLYGEGRGLKLDRVTQHSLSEKSLLSMERGVD